jgi:hypothetical protein
MEPITERADFKIDWSRAVMLRRSSVPDPQTGTPKAGAYIYLEGGHVVFVFGEWDDMCRRFDTAINVRLGTRP